MSLSITKTIEFDAGHRVPGHKGMCRNPHGHRYKVDCTFSGEVPADGMILDFGVLKDIMRAVIHDRYDHGFIVDERDHALIQAFTAADPAWKVVQIDRPPTAENLAAIISTKLAEALAFHEHAAGVKLVSVTVWETPSSRATAWWSK